MVIGSKRLKKKSKKLPELIYSYSLKVEKKSKNSRYKGKYIRFIFTLGSYRYAYYTSKKKT
jgi:hypothetical protein